jgi:hypothetical protein
MEEEIARVVCDRGSRDGSAHAMTYPRNRTDGVIAKIV